MRPAVDVSVIVPARDAAATIAEAVASILGGTRAPREIILVDDRSRDDSVDIARRAGPGLEVIRAEGEGPGAARNTGARRARGEWLAFLDAEDLWEPLRLERGMAAASHAPSDAAVHGRIRQFFDPTLGRSGRPVPEISDACHPDTLLIRRRTFLAEGGYPESGATGEVVRWYADRRDAGRPFIFIPEVLASRRIHTRNTALRSADRRADYVLMVKTLLDRRRADRRAQAGIEEASDRDRGYE
jgi:glycosyltransferase involved in cell wall biosynthesis